MELYENGFTIRAIAPESVWAIEEERIALTI